MTQSKIIDSIISDLQITNLISFIKYNALMLLIPFLFQRGRDSLYLLYDTLSGKSCYPRFERC